MNGVAAAAEQIESNDDAGDVDADHAGSTPDVSADADAGDVEAVDPDAEPEPTSMIGRLSEPLEGNISEDRIGNLWNPDSGGLNRLAHVAEEVAGLSDGLPRAAHLAIGALEAMENHAEGFSLGNLGPDSDAEDDDESDAIADIDGSQL